MPPILESSALAGLPHIRHAFFTRRGGVSCGQYASLNTGLGSNDARQSVRQNRARCAEALGVDPDRLVTLYQIHSSRAITVTSPFSAGEAPQADGMASTARAMALGALAADCAPVLFADAAAPVIGVAHAGWKGALDGILEDVIAAMETLGARAPRIVAAIGPCISQNAYEVGPEFEDRFISRDHASSRFFRAGHGDRKLFDLPGYVAGRLRSAGLTSIDILGRCTYAEDAQFFSYRRATHQGETDYGRNLSAIALR